MDTQLSYIICFVDDFDQAIGFYRDTLGFPLRFQSPDWTEFSTGQTTLALHPALAYPPCRHLPAWLSRARSRAIPPGFARKGLPVHSPACA